MVREMVGWGGREWLNGEMAEWGGDTIGWSRK